MLRILCRKTWAHQIMPGAEITYIVIRIRVELNVSTRSLKNVTLLTGCRALQAHAVSTKRLHSTWTVGCITPTPQAAYYPRVPFHLAEPSRTLYSWWEPFATILLLQFYVRYRKATENCNVLRTTGLIGIKYSVSLVQGRARLFQRVLRSLNLKKARYPSKMRIHELVHASSSSRSTIMGGRRHRLSLLETLPFMYFIFAN